MEERWRRRAGAEQGERNTAPPEPYMPEIRLAIPSPRRLALPIESAMQMVKLAAAASLSDIAAPRGQTLGDTATRGPNDAPIDLSSASACRSSPATSGSIACSSAWCSPARPVVDVGANIGYNSIRAARLAAPAAGKSQIMRYRPRARGPTAVAPQRVSRLVPAFTEPIASITSGSRSLRIRVS
jgi:hypothetical protein